MYRAIHAIARFTLLEAVRTRLPWLLAAGVAVAVAAALFAGSIAITESAEVRAVVLGSCLRLFVVLVVASFVVTSMVRETHDKGVELVLALSLPRAAYYFGKLLGHALVAIGAALAAGATATVFAPAAAAAVWGASLACELVVVAALALLTVLTFSQVPAALCAVLAVYALARMLDALLLIAHGPVIAASGPADRVMIVLLDGIGHLLPHLARFAPSEWLAYHEASWAQVLPNLGQAAVFLVLLVAASLFDLYRKDF